jgi:hypothetical protein
MIIYKTTNLINNKIYGRVISQEHRNKISLSKKGQSIGSKNPMFGKTGINSPLFGRKHSEETKIKMREAQRIRFQNRLVS